ncbi:NB-ARC domain-containing protein [Nocardia sp. NPDC059177]|uniref:NB-ARC domain-containing protein n=1 Tax=Nocardia sp. NPDC059177 TaxID=3346759 RepID=UPI0036C04B1E
MAAHVRRCKDAELPALMYVYGLEGLGVSCLTAQFGREHRNLVGDQTVWLSGRRRDGTVVPVGELFNRAFLQLKISAADQGTTEEEKSDSLQRVWQDRRFALVLDDLDNLGQIQPFIPSDIPGAVVLATSPLRRRTLEQRDFAGFTPDLLDDDAARTLLVTGMKDTAGELDPAVIDELTDFCHGLPLLVKVLSAQIHGRPYRAHYLLTELRNSGLRPHQLDGEMRIQKFLDTAYSNLDEAEKDAYRLLGLLPIENIGLDAAAAVLGAADGDAVYPILERLVELNLLVPVDPNNPRYAFHPVVHHDARDRATAIDSPPVREAAVSTWITWYLRETLARAAVVSDRWWVRPVTELLIELHNGRVPRFTRPQALEWFELEGDNAIAAVRAAHGARLHRLVWPFCVALWKYLHLHGLHDAWIDIHLLGLASARTEESDLGMLQMTSQLGAVYLELREFDSAREHFTKSLGLARKHHHVLGMQSALEWLGKIAAAEGQFDIALTDYQQSWDVIAQATDEQIAPAERARAYAILWLQRARAELGAGRPDRALAAADHAVAAFKPQATEIDNNAKAHLIRGRAHFALDATASAISDLRTAFELFDDERVEKQKAITSHLLGDAHRAAGDPTAALESYRLALDYYQRVGNIEAATVAHTITELMGDR